MRGSEVPAKFAGPAVELSERLELDKGIESVDSKGGSLQLRKPNRASLMLVFTIMSLGLMWIVFSKYAVPPLIKSAYRGESLPILNRMISGQASHPVAEYLRDWESLRWRLLLDLSLVGLLVLLVTRPEFHRALWEYATPPQEYSVFSSYSGYLYIVLAISAAYLLYFCLALPARLFHIRFLFDPNDLAVYFNSSAWILGKGKLYIDVPSEYPILANLLFGWIRFVSSKIRLFSSQFYNFSLIWITSASSVFVCLLAALHKRKVSGNSWLVWLLLAPTTIYFSLLRYDIYPVFFSLLGLEYLRRRKWNSAALLFGICVALKGYALIVVPSFFVFCWYQIGLRPALLAIAAMLSPSVVSNLAVFLWGGKEAMLAPYKLQIFRGFNRESSFSSLFFLGSRFGISPSRIAGLSSWLLENHFPKISQSAIAIGACFFRPARFESFVHAAFLSVLGFMTFSPFYSPQFVLWLIPFLLFTYDRVLLFMGIFLVWGTYVYYPVAYDIHVYSGNRSFLAISIIAVTAIRFFMMARLIKILGTKEPGTAAVSSAKMPLAD